MKTFTSRLASVMLLLTIGTASLSAQSCAVATHVSKAASHSGNASGEALAASGELGLASLKTASAAAAIPFWTGGAVVAAGGSAVAAVGASTAAAGATVAHSAEKMWDFATNDPARRPALDRERSVPPIKSAARRDPPPSEALRGKL